MQVRLESPLPLARGDRFILRYPSPGETIGGGVVVDPAPGRRWRRHRPDVIARLEMLARGTPAELAAQALERIGAPARIEAILKRSGLPAAELQAALADARRDGLAFEMEGGWWLAAQTYALIVRQLQNELAAFHAAEPLRRGMPREQLRSRLGLERAPFERILERAADLAESDADLVWRRGHTVSLTARQQQAVDELRRVFERAPYLPPSVKGGSGSGWRRAFPLPGGSGRSGAGRAGCGAVGGRVGRGLAGRGGHAGQRGRGFRARAARSLRYVAQVRHRLPGASGRAGHHPA